ncbi:MAG: hypothetical protein AB7F59_07995 [Bdellovibrionales bacterium]
MLTVAVSAEAQTFLYLGKGFRNENNPTGSGSTARNPLWLGGGYLLENVGLASDLMYFSHQSSASYLTVKTEQYEWMLWPRYSPFGLRTWFPFVEGGVGLQQTIVETDFLSQSNKSYSVLYGVFGMGLGIWNSVYKGISVGAHLRTQWRPKTSPQFTYDLLGVVGYQF